MGMETEQASLQLNYPQVTPLLQELNELQETAAADQQLPVTSFRQVKQMLCLEGHFSEI